MSIKTTAAGSWWIAPELEEDLARLRIGQLDDGRAEDVLNAAAAKAIAEQREIGFDEWTGGEYFASDFLRRVHYVLTGLQVLRPEAEAATDYDDGPLTRIVGELSAPNGLGYAAAYRREAQLPGGVKKATVVAPAELLSSARDQPDEVRRQMPVLTEIVNREIRELADAGCEHVQLDAPVLGVLVNEGLMTAQAAAEMIAPCFDGVEATRGIHICNGNLRGRPGSRVLACAPWVEILQHLDGAIDVAHLEVKYFSQWREREAFREMPASIQLAAGIVDEANYWVEPVDKLKSRIEDWLSIVGEDRLWASPSCGFGRHPARDIPVIRQKLENLVAAAAAF